MSRSQVVRAILLGMPCTSLGRGRRSTAAERAGEERAEFLARRIGIALHDARRALRLRQVDVAARAGISQPHVSRIERGLEIHAPLLTLAACAAAVNAQLAAFVEARPGADLPRDLEHLRRQLLVITESARGGWAAEPEAVVSEPGAPPRSIDLLLTRPVRREAAVVEIWTLLADVGAAMRGLDRKLLATRERRGTGWTVAPLLIVRGTRRNRHLVVELRPLFAARYRASSVAWLRALTSTEAPMPLEGGFLWTDVASDRLRPARLG